MKDRFIFDLLHLKKILHICVIFLCNIAWNSLRDLFDVFTKHKNRNTSYIFHPIAMLNSNQINLTSIEDKTICTFTKKVYQKDHLAHWFFFHCKNNNLIMFEKKLWYHYPKWKLRSFKIFKMIWVTTRTFLLNKIARYLTSFASFYAKTARNDDDSPTFKSRTANWTFLSWIYPYTNHTSFHLVRSILLIQVYFRRYRSFSYRAIFWKGCHNNCTILGLLYFNTENNNNI